MFATVEAEFDLPACLLYAVGSKETGLAREYAEGKVHNDGHGWGLFGADDRWNKLDLPHFASDPEEQARLAARTLRANFNRLGNWPDAVNAYGPAAGRPAYGVDVLERAGYLASITGETPVTNWHPRAHDASANKAGGSFIGVAPKIVLHTVEGRGRYSYNPGSYYGNPYWPHATIDGAGIHQHLPIDVSAFALANSAGGAETNRANAIQCEILWFAGEIADLPDDIMRHVADWVGWVAEQTGTPLDFAEFRGDGSYGEGAPQRFSAQEWLEFTGVCGHQHVPENDHWDPGAFPVDRLRALLGADPTNPDNPPEEDDMAVALPLFGDAPDGREGGLWMVFGVLRKRVHTTQVWDDFHRLGAKHIGDVDKESGGKLPVAMFDGTIDIEKALVAARIAGTTEGASVDALADAVLREMYERLAS